MPSHEQARIDNIGYKAPKGESWLEVQARALKFFESLSPASTFLIFTHGGLICSLTYDFGYEDVPGCGDVTGVVFNEQTKQIEKVEFQWQFPTEELN